MDNDGKSTISERIMNMYPLKLCLCKYDKVKNSEIRYVTNTPTE